MCSIKLKNIIKIILKKISFQVVKYKFNDFERAVRFFILNRITFSGTVDSGGYSKQAFEHMFTFSSIERVMQLKGRFLRIAPSKGLEERLTILQSPCRMV